MANISSLIGGFRVFKATEFSKLRDMIRHVIQLGQKPTTVVVCCSDMRLSPGTIFSSNPGDVYVVSNIGGLVPAYGESKGSGIQASIEHAINNMEIENIVVMGHAHCSVLKDYLNMNEKNAEKNKEIKQWLDIGKAAKDAVLAQLGDKDEEEKEISHVQETVLVSLKNLLSYPNIGKKIDSNKVKLYGWMVNLRDGQLMAFNPQTRMFDTIE